MLRGHEFFGIGIELIQRRALYPDKDRHDADDRIENFIEVIQTDDRLRHLQQRGGSVRLLLRNIVQARIFDGNGGITSERGRHRSRFVAISARRMMRERDHAERMVAHSQRRRERGIILVEACRKTRRAHHIGWLAYFGAFRFDHAHQRVVGFRGIVQRFFQQGFIEVMARRQIQLIVFKKPDGRNIHRQILFQLEQNHFEDVIHIFIGRDQASHFAQTVGNLPSPLL